MLSAGLLIIRLVVGLTFAAHGTQKLFGWFKGPGLKGFAGWLESLNIKPPFLNAFVAAFFEIVAGLLFAAGVWMWVAAALIILTMLVAIVKVHGKNGYIQPNGFEYNLHLIAIAIGMALVGPGAYVL